MRSRFLTPILIICATAFIFFPSLFTFFVQDDFWLLASSNVKSFSDIIGLFLPQPQIVWYRPFSSQAFFALGQLVFGLNPLPYHIIVLVTHIFTSFLLYRFLILIKFKRETGWLAAIFYATHQLHTISLSWLAAYSFILGPMLLLLTIIFYLQKKYIEAFFVTVLGCLTNEALLLTPVFLIPFISFDYSNNRRNKWWLLVPFGLLSAVIIYLRKIAYPTQVTTALYQFHFSSSIISTLKFYTLRLLSVPLLFDEMSTLIKISILTLTFIFSLSVIRGVIYNWHTEKRNLVLFLLLTAVGMLPFLFLPDHLAPHYLSFALIGWSAVAAASLQIQLSKYKWLKIFIIVLFLLTQFIGSRWTYKTHWLFTREKLAKKLVSEASFEFPAGSEEYYSLGANSAKDVFITK